MKVKQRDIILIKFPFSDLSGAKVRPALVLSNNQYNQKKLDAVVLAITSNLSQSEYKVIVESKDLDNGKLPTKSAVRIDKPFSISQNKVLKIQGNLNIKKFKEVKNAILKLIH
ncbi:MAG: type II toxin-antitoxin system PemK/MazF family toxin [Xenococcus sp. (in: cyanobacteria)]